MADAVQHPGKRPGVSLVLRGKQGVGKGVFVTQFGKLFGHHFRHLSNPRHLTGNFNAHLQDALIVFADEAFWSGNHRAEGVLKAMVTEERWLIEPKGKDAYEVQNHIRLVVASNKDWAVPAELEERRFCVIDVSDAYMQDEDYFAAIIEQMDNGGREALLYHLQHIDLTTVKLRNFPKTQALLETKILSMKPAEQFLYDRLRNGSLYAGRPGWDEDILCEFLHDEYAKFTQRTRG